MNDPHPQPLSPRREELEILFPLLGERARVRANLWVHTIIQQRRKNNKAVTNSLTFLDKQINLVALILKLKLGSLLG